MTCPYCEREFTATREGNKFCSASCRGKAYRAQGRTAEMRSRRGLRCHWCRGHHHSLACPNRAGATIKLYGTMGPNREYVPPPGVKVRVVSIPNTVHGDRIGKLLENLR